MAFYTYLLRCSDGTYYTGHTDHLDRRLAEHASGEWTGYTAKRLPVELVWSERFQTREQAKEVEAKVKGWSKAKKEALMAGDWDEIARLGRGGEGPSTSSG